MDKARVIGVWTCGLVASGIFGVLITEAARLDRDQGVPGLICGVFAFACARLWLAEKRP